MKIEPAEIAGVQIVTPTKNADNRGFFSETFKQSAFTELSPDLRFVQDNHTFSAASGTVRGLHFQAPPFAQHKLIRVVRGRILDVAVDLRRSSPTFGKHVSLELSATNWRQLLVPIGFGHGFCTLDPDTEVLYKVSDYYSPGHEFGIAWDDPALAIPWPVDATAAVLSERDRRHPKLEASPHLFA